MSNILRFCDGFQEASFEAGTTILKQGVKSKSVYIIIDGAVEVSADDAHVKILSEPGTVFGELAALLDEPRIANVIATQDCREVRRRGASTLEGTTKWDEEAV